MTTGQKIGAQLNELDAVRENFIDALEAKGVTGIVGDEKYEKLVEKIEDIPSGGILINGSIVQKEIVGQNIAKGDFVKNSLEQLTYRLNNSNDISIVGNMSNQSYLFDNNDDTYCTLTGSIGRLYFKCKSKTQLGIPSNAKIVDAIMKIKYKYSTVHTNNKIIPARFDCPFPTSPTLINLASPLAPQDSTLHILEFSFEPYLNIQNTEKIGAQIMTNNSVNLYYIDFIISYESNNKIQKVTSTSDIIIGISNENGENEDIIETYIPNIEGGVS